MSPARLLLLLLPLLLAGCALTSGMTMSRGFDSGLTKTDQPAPITPQAELVPITTQLVSTMGQVRREAATAAQQLRADGQQYEPYRIGPRDILTIIVWGHPELTIPTGEFRAAGTAGQMVNEKSDMYYPYVGILQVAGMTPSELREPGIQPINDIPLTVAEAISRSGGVPAEAAPEQALP